MNIKIVKAEILRELIQEETGGIESEEENLYIELDVSQLNNYFRSYGRLGNINSNGIMRLKLMSIYINNNEDEELNYDQ